jgi:hypothetical protein
MQQALAPETSTILDYYRGASGKAGRELTGGQRDTALAELDREKVGKLALMAPMARANAATGAAQVGTTQVGQGGNMIAQGGYLQDALTRQGTQMAEQGRQGGSAIGKFLFDIMQGIGKGKGGGANPIYGTNPASPYYGTTPMLGGPNPMGNGGGG